MARVYATGMGPLPWEKHRFLHGSCHRTWQLVGPMLEAGHEVCLVALRIFDQHAPKDLPLVQKQQKDGLIYILADELKKFVFPDFHQPIIDEFQPDAVIGITTPACSPLEHLRTNAPMWLDIHGYVMGEAQIMAEILQEDGHVYQLWKRYDGSLYRAACFSTTSDIQRHTLIGELGALGRLNRYTAGYEFVHSIPLGRPDIEIRPTRTVLRGKEVPQDAWVLFWLGGYNYWCDPETLFHGLDRAMDRNEKIHFVSTGGPIASINEISFTRFESLVKQSAHRDRYHFVGWVASEDIPNYLLEADAGINVDRICYESVYGARHRIVEMLRAGLPVITTRITEISRQVEQAGAGMGCPPEQPDALAETILKIAGDPGCLAEMGNQGRRLFQQQFTDPITVKPLLDWLEHPSHAPDWGKPIPRRENLLYDKLQARPFWRKVHDHFHSRWQRLRRR